QYAGAGAPCEVDGCKSGVLPMRVVGGDGGKPAGCYLVACRQWPHPSAAPPVDVAASFVGELEVDRRWACAGESGQNPAYFVVGVGVVPCSMGWADDQE